MAAKPDAVRKRIIAFNEANGGGVVIQKAAKGYSLFREDNGRPVARLRPTGKGDEVEVLWWSHRDRWDQIGDFGPMTMPLDEALGIIRREGPDRLFLGLMLRARTLAGTAETGPSIPQDRRQKRDLHASFDCPETRIFYAINNLVAPQTSAGSAYWLYIPNWPSARREEGQQGLRFAVVDFLQRDLGGS